MTMRIESPAFAPLGAIPRDYTCDGADRSPPLRWSGVPEGAKSLALIVEDPDAPDPAKPQRIYTHWVLYDLPPSTEGLAEGVDSSALPPGTREGLNDAGKTGYGGPCPPIGRHRYFFKLFALDANLDGSQPMTRLELLRAMKGHVMESAELVGTYAR
jgi:Raf kinase inhibitor-like YbhB/YbcL family protein